MIELAITIHDLGKMYRLYDNPGDKVMDAFGINNLLFWRKLYYQEFWALRGLNLEVKRGERLGIIGRNGAGKSTLLKIITGNITPTEGLVKVRGRVQALMELGTGFHPEFTGRQNIQASLAYQGISSAKIKILEEEIIDFSELDDFIDQPIKTYSAGMYARLAFTVATVVEPEILIIDEVLGAGDAYFGGKCVERMRKLTEESGATVLFVSHDLGSVQALCDRVIWVQKGIIVGDGQPLDVIKQYSALVRKDEEIRLKARDLKVSKKQASILEQHKDIYQKFLFRFITTDNSHPKYKHKIRSIVLKNDQDIIGRIDVGSPMDNHPDQEHYLMTNNGFMDWGSVDKDQIGFYRLYANFKGKYAHAPFQFSVPRSYLHNSSDFILEVQADCKQERVSIELFSPQDNTYQNIGFLNTNDYQNTLVIPKQMFVEDDKHLFGNINKSTIPSKNTDNKFVLSKTSAIDEYGSRQEATITNISLLNASKQTTKTLHSLEPFQVVLEYITSISISNPTFVFCVYLPSGLTVSQWVISTKQLGQETVEGSGKIIFHSDQLLLGTGSYIASAAIFKSFPKKNLEPDSYHVLDRCIHFQVINQEGLESIDYGLCRQPIEFKIQSTI
jgi:lipopolysaccharide transport system ATP-binding protein